MRTLRQEIQMKLGFEPSLFHTLDECVLSKLRQRMEEFKLKKIRNYGSITFYFTKLV